MIGWILLSFFFLLLLWLMLAPIRLRINTFQGFYQIQWGGILTATYDLDNAPFCMEMQVLFLKKTICIERFFSRKKTPEPEEYLKPIQKRRRKGRSISGREIWLLLRNILKSFRIRKFRIWWDSDDYVRNAYLYPIAVATWGKEVEVYINYQGQRALILDIENRLGAIALALIRSFIHK